MKLKMLREHYIKDGISWVPKRSFESKQAVKDETGYNPELCNLYECTVCKSLHIATYPRLGSKNV